MERKPGETLFQYAMRVAWFTGQIWKLPDGGNIKQSDLANLHPTDDIAVRALIELAKSDVTAYTIKSLDNGHDPDFVGALNPGMEAMLDVQRCPVPDVAPPPGVVFSFDDPDLQKVVVRMQERQTLAAIGSGNWAGCHNVGNFHSASIQVNTQGLPAFLAPLLKTVLTNTQKAYAAIGLLFRFIDAQNKDMLTGTAFNGVINSDMSFVSNSSGWIGLAIVGQNEECDSTIWCKFLSTYKGGSTDAAIVTQWTSLIKHELGHNCGRGHTNGGVMNPSIINGLPTEWGPSDPSTDWLKGQFGGTPVPIPGGNPNPGPDPNPTPVPTVESRLRALEIQDVVQAVTIQWCVNKIKNLP